MLIELQNVSYAYTLAGGLVRPALTGVDLRIDTGELLVVIGHSGSGKSTLALLLSGLYHPTEGRVVSYELHHEADRIFRGVGLVFQYPEQQLFAETVFEEVAFGARNFGMPQDYLSIRVRQALTKVGLDPDEMWYRSPFTLSGGQKRRVCLAGALAMDPRLIILDEPTAGLDEGGRRWMLELARELHEQGRTIVWITHDMAEAAELSQRLVVLSQGRVLLDGSPEQVFSQEEELRGHGLDIPPAAYVVRRLKERGAELPGLAVTAEQAGEEILGWKQGAYAPQPEEEAPEPHEEEPVLDIAAILSGGGESHAR